MKITRTVFAEGVQWIGTKGSLKQIHYLTGIEEIEVTERKNTLKLTIAEEEKVIELNEWIVKENNTILALTEKQFNTIYNLK